MAMAMATAPRHQYVDTRGAALYLAISPNTLACWRSRREGSHPLLDPTLDIVIERHRDLLRRGAVLVDERDFGVEPRMRCRHHEHAAEDHWRQWRQLRFQLKLFHPSLQPPLQIVRTLPCFVRIQPGVGSARHFLQLQRFSAMIPVIDFLGEAVLHGRLGRRDQLELLRPHLLEVLGHHIRNGV